MPVRLNTKCFLLTYISSGFLSIILPILFFTIARLQNSYSEPDEDESAANQVNEDDVYDPSEYFNYNNKYNGGGYYSGEGGGSSYTSFYSNQNANQQNHYAYQSSYQNQNQYNSNQKQYAYSQNQYSYQQNQYGYSQNQYNNNQNLNQYNWAYGGNFNDNTSNEPVEVEETENMSPWWWAWGGQDSEPRDRMVKALLVIYICCLPVFIGILIYGVRIARTNNFERLHSLVPILFVSAMFTLVATILVGSIDGLVQSNGIELAEDGWYGQVGVLVYLTTLFWTIFAVMFGCLLRQKAFQHYRETIDTYKMHEEPKEHSHVVPTVAEGSEASKADNSLLEESEGADESGFVRAMTMPAKAWKRARDKVFRLNENGDIV